MAYQTADDMLQYNCQHMGRGNVDKQMNLPDGYVKSDHVGKTLRMPDNLDAFLELMFEQWTALA